MLENGRQIEGHRENANPCYVEEGPARRESHVRRLSSSKVAVQGQVPLHGSRLRGKESYEYKLKSYIIS